MTKTHINDDNQDLYYNLVEEVKKKVQKLKELGMTDKEIISLLHTHTEQPLVKMTVTRNYWLYLEEKQIEVHMEPLVKAVYLLFLKHPEGITFKCLPDYRKELTQIYVKLKPYGMSDRVLQSIEDVTNPLLNSINEKCAKIRKIFLSILDGNVVEHYCISGTRGKVKKISLPRDLVVWE